MCPPLRAHSQVRPSGIVTDATIISELGGAKEEAGLVQGAMARQYQRRVVELRGSYLNFFLSWISFEFGKLYRRTPVHLSVTLKTNLILLENLLPGSPCLSCLSVPGFLRHRLLKNLEAFALGLDLLGRFQHHLGGAVVPPH
jgi:hypothetical protein